MSKPTAFPLDESKLPFEIPKDAALREKIRETGAQMITDRIPAKLNAPPDSGGPRVLGPGRHRDRRDGRRCPKDEGAQADDACPELVKATGKTAEELEPLLYQMTCVGLLEYNWENPRREKQYVLPMFVPGSAEFFNMNKQQIAEHPEVTAFFERMTFLPLERHHRHGAAGRCRHRHARHPRGKSHRDREPVAGHRAHLPLAEKVRGQVCGEALLLPDVPRGAWARAAATTLTTGASAWAIWRIIWWRPTRATISPTTKCMQILQTRRGQRLCAPDHQH